LCPSCYCDLEGPTVFFSDGFNPMNCFDWPFSAVLVMLDVFGFGVDLPCWAAEPGFV